MNRSDEQSTPARPPAAPDGPLHPADLPEAALLAECRITRTRRSGPGGQNRNKVETAVVLEHLPTGHKAEASERRSQGQNQTMALFRLRLILALHVRLPIDRRPAPTPLWQSRCRGGRIAVNPAHLDFPSILAEALDHLAAADMDPAPAAQALGITPSQLLKLIKDEPRAMRMLNDHREARGQHKLK